MATESLLALTLALLLVPALAYPCAASTANDASEASDASDASYARERFWHASPIALALALPHTHAQPTISLDTINAQTVAEAEEEAENEAEEQEEMEAEAEVAVGAIMEAETEVGGGRVKRNGPAQSLSIVAPLDVLRQRLMNELNRRRMRELQGSRIQQNRQLLTSIGKRRTASTAPLAMAPWGSWRERYETERT